MRKGNGKTEANLDLEHELPPAEDGEEIASAAPSPVVPVSDVDKLLAERDALLDRLVTCAITAPRRPAPSASNRNFASLLPEM